ncbi:MAG TPA: pyridoxamine 5'-phosphate oxidase family protein [Saprospiraceae bacterium]|nr:pyridoxamine 5'-phosphate oxidase family protein [Saprospiraceae bacterium]
MLLPNQLKQFLLEPRFYWMATRNQDFICEIHRVLGVQVAGTDILRIFIYQGTASRTKENLLANKLIAFSVTSGFTFESYQIKGKLLEIRPVNEEEEVLMKNYIVEMDKMLVALGYSVSGVLTETLYTPAWSVEFSIEQVFDQTPKVGTGKLLTSV